MFALKKIRLNDFKEVVIPKRKELYGRFCGRACPDYNRMPTADDLPDNLIGNKMDDFRNGLAVISREVSKREREALEKLSLDNPKDPNDPNDPK